MYFFFLKEKVRKRSKNPDGLSLGHSFFRLKLLAPPRVEILKALLSKFTRNHGAFLRFADFLWFAKMIQARKDLIKFFRGINKTN